jgi:hypothetical protein
VILTKHFTMGSQFLISIYWDVWLSLLAYQRDAHIKLCYCLFGIGNGQIDLLSFGKMTLAFCLNVIGPIDFWLIVIWPIYLRLIVIWQIDFRSIVILQIDICPMDTETNASIKFWMIKIHHSRYFQSSYTSIIKLNLASMFH